LLIILILAVVSIYPAPASAAINAGIKPGSFWYTFDIAFEKVSLFFTFNPEKKVRKALDYANERIAEAEALAEEKNSDAVKTAITNYESNIALVAEKSKEVKDKQTAEKLLFFIADNTSKHQEILVDVLAKVPDEAKESITKAIEVSRKGQEEAMKQIAELKGEVEQLKKEVAELKEKEAGFDNTDRTAEIEKLKKELAELKTKPAPVNVAPPNTISCNGKYWTSCPAGQRFYCPSTGDAQCLIDNVSNQNNQNSLESWEQIEARDFVYADAKGWTSLISTNALGEKRYYRKEENLWVRKNSEAEITQPYLPAPTLQQLTNIRRVCLWDDRLKAICDDPNFTFGYNTNSVFRKKIDEMNASFLDAMAQQQQQKIAAEKSIMDCLMTPSPEEERLLDPDTKMYLLQLRCGTVTAADRTNYELSRLKSSVDELRYRLDSKISFPSLYLDPIKTPTFSIPRWQIHWEGSGGTVTDSSGNFYQFHCEDNTCRSY